VADARWSPDGKWIAFSMFVPERDTWNIRMPAAPQGGHDNLKSRTRPPLSRAAALCYDSAIPETRVVAGSKEEIPCEDCS
jgi:hypothetical protein